MPAAANSSLGVGAEIRGGRTAAWRLSSATPLLTLCVAAVAVVAACAGGGEKLAMRRADVLASDWWQIFTGHLVHFGPRHAAWDILALLVLGLLVEARSRLQFALTLVGSMVWVSLGVLWLRPEIVEYRGLSGVDSALFGMLAMGMLLDAIRQRDRLRISLVAAAGAAFIAKTVFEITTGSALFVGNMGEGVTAVSLAHVIGFAWGVFVEFIPLLKRQLISRTNLS